MEIPNFDGWEPEDVISFCEMATGLTPEQKQLNILRAEERERRHAEYCEEKYKEGCRGYYKKSCPICGTVFYTDNIRRKYDDYYKCSRYQHRKNAKWHREIRRITVCKECGKVFTPQRAGAKYCSTACKQKAYRKRKQSQNEYTEQP